VVVGRHVAPDGFDVVRVADDLGVAAAVEHLRALGHRRIVHVDGGRAATADDRRAGFAAAAGPEGRIVPGGYDEAAGAGAARALLDDLPTAVVAANDRSAIGLLDVFLRAGVRVPADVSVVGYDDSALARLAHVDLTTVSQERTEQARRAVAAAAGRLDAGAAPAGSVLTPRLVVRGTTGPAPDGLTGAQPLRRSAPQTLSPSGAPDARRCARAGAGGSARRAPRRRPPARPRGTRRGPPPAPRTGPGRTPRC
jgi:DNA-binding LacI/PurR family transcriptional regulator